MTGGSPYPPNGDSSFQPAAPIPHVRSYGATGAWLTLLHGGPGAPGHLAPVARALADAFRILEPFERRSGGPLLTVALHVSDVEATIRRHAGLEPTALLGFSSGAVTALAFAAAHAGRVSQVILVAAATMDPRSREEFRAALDARLNAAARRELYRASTVADSDERLRIQRDATAPAYFVDPFSTETEEVWYDGAGHDQTWSDVVRLQATGRHPADFATIRVPVLMIHGAQDPHPGTAIRAALAPYLPQLEYHELQRCGHYPWLERAARDEFLATIRARLTDPRHRLRDPHS